MFLPCPVEASWPPERDIPTSNSNNSSRCLSQRNRPGDSRQSPFGDQSGIEHLADVIEDSSARADDCAKREMFELTSKKWKVTERCCVRLTTIATTKLRPFRGSRLLDQVKVSNRTADERKSHAGNDSLEPTEPAIDRFAVIEISAHPVNCDYDIDVRKSRSVRNAQRM